MVLFAFHAGIIGLGQLSDDTRLTMRDLIRVTSCGLCAIVVSFLGSVLITAL